MKSGNKETYPLIGSAFQVEGTSIVGKVGEDNPQVHKTSEHTGAETSNWSRSDLGKIDRANNNLQKSANSFQYRQR